MLASITVHDNNVSFRIYIVAANRHNISVNPAYESGSVTLSYI